MTERVHTHTHTHTHTNAQTEQEQGRSGASLRAQVAKNVPAMQETQVPSLDWKDRLEKGMATHSSVLAWRIP